MNRRTSAIILLLIFAIGVFFSILRPAQPWWRLANILWLASLMALIRLWLLVWQEVKAEEKGQWWKKRTPLFTDFCCLLLVCGACSFMYWRAASGDRPISGDHTLHYFRFWQFITELVPQHKLFGWSNLWFGGEPVSYLYPVGGSVWAAMVYWLGFGLFTLDQAYATAVWLAYAVEGIAIYFTAKYIFGRSTGVVAALLAATDIGAYTNMGGWYMTVKTGVWPNTLSVAFSLFALAAFLRLLNKGEWCMVGWFALAAGISLIFHPLQIINLPVILGTTVGAYIVCGQIRLCRAQAKKILVAILLTSLIAAVWILPLILAKEFTHSDNKVWTNLAEMGKSLYQGSLYPGMWKLTAVLGFVGALAALASSTPAHFAVGILFFLFMLLGSKEFGALVADLSSADTASKIEYLRFATLLRPFWAITAGWAVCAVFQASDWGGRFKQPTLRGMLSTTFFRAFAALLIVPPLIFPFLQAWYSDRTELFQEFLSTRDQKERPALVQWLKDQAAETPEFFRVVFYDRMHVHMYFDLATELPVPVYNLGWSPVTGYRYQLGYYDPEVLQALSVRYVLATEAMQPKLINEMYDTPEPQLKLIGNFGPVYVNEFVNWNPQRFAIIEGSGSVQVSEFADEKIVLEAAPGSSGKLRLGVSYFDRWEATRDGSPVPIFPTKVGVANESAFMTVDLQPGRYEFRFVRHWPEKLGFLSILAGVLSLLITLMPSNANLASGAFFKTLHRARGKF
jgi:hypothetical protein